MFGLPTGLVDFEGSLILAVVVSGAQTAVVVAGSCQCEPCSVCVCVLLSDMHTKYHEDMLFAFCLGRVK